MNSDKNVKYRKKSDILHLNLGERSHESVPRGGFIIDIDSKGRVVGIEVLDASEILKDLDVEDTQEFLDNLVDGDIVLKEKMGLTWIIMKLYSVIEEEKKEETFRFEVPKAEDSNNSKEVV